MSAEPGLYKEVLDSLYDGVYFVDDDRTITYWNKAAERLTGYSAAEVVGRRCADNILNHVDGQGTVLCENGCPLAATMEDGQPRAAEVYLHHKNGHRAPVAVRATPLRNAHGETVGAIEIFGDNGPKVAATERVKELENVAYLDPLTSLPNRRYAETVLSSRFNELRRYGWNFGVVFFDIDHFKHVNDVYGHEVGDRVLTMVAGTLGSNVRSFDLVSRWGGEEFLVVVGHVDKDQLSAVAEKLRSLVAQSGFALGQGRISVTVSGGASLAQITDEPETLVERADRLMYLSKSGGRNRISTTLPHCSSGATSGAN
jgi:diguanylate cyclase (GGDEF)-like protein/PAS domain S-box-containing protein